MDAGERNAGEEKGYIRTSEADCRDFLARLASLLPPSSYNILFSPLSTDLPTVF
jgi:hypothetical protein